MMKRYQLSDFIKSTTKPAYFISKYDKLYRIDYNRPKKVYEVYINRIKKRGGDQKEWVYVSFTRGNDSTLSFILQYDLKPITKAEAFLMAL